MKTAVIITPFDNYSYNVRIRFVEKYLKKIGYEVKVISSNFDHRNKLEYNNSRQGLELLSVPKYKRNLSFARIWSHREFARKSVNRANEIQPDLLYVSGPPNFLFKYFSKSKRKHPKIKLIYEIGDMWPETLPLDEKKKSMLSFLLGIWSTLRDKYIGVGDYTIFECDLFKDMVTNRVKKVKGDTIYMCKEKSYFSIDSCRLSNELIEMVYLGSINNIIDIEFISNIVEKIAYRKAICVHIIGDGEQKDRLISCLEKVGAEVRYHGIIYDEEQKNNIFNQCHFALNIMKKSVCVGMTMKSIDYFEAGIALINNIPNDTTKLVEENECGFNINTDNIDDVVMRICNLRLDEIKNMRSNSRKLFESYFSVDAFEKKFDVVIKNVMYRREIENEEENFDL